MKRTALVLLCLSVLVFLLTGCQGQQQGDVFNEVTQYIGLAETVSTETAAPAAADDTIISSAAIDDTAAYTEEDIMGEEADSMMEADTTEYVDANYEVQTSLFSSSEDTAVAATAYPYTGTTPIPLNPVDAPTPTPQAPLNFTYITYSPTNIGVSFEAPAGWVADETYNEVFTLSEPATQIKDGQRGIINVYAIPVSSDYSEAELVTEIKQRLNTIGSLNFSEWRPSLTATRYLMGSMGVYANYYGTLVTGIEVGGRIHATTIDNVLYCIQITYPLAFRDDFMDVFAQLRETISRTY